MKKLLKSALIFIFIIAVGLIVFDQPVSAKHDINPGSLIKGERSPGVYYLGEDNKRYVFPNAKTYFSWFEDFNNIFEVEDGELANYQLGGNMRYKPGSLLVKIQTSPRVYAVGNNGKLRWVKTEYLAKKLYGENWNLLIDDIPDSFFVDYKIDNPIDNDEEYDPEEEEEETPTPSYNLRLKKQKKVARIITSKKVKACYRLENAINKIQKRIARLGLEIPELGDDYLAQCIEANSIPFIKKKIAICHVPPGDPNETHTINISKSAAKAHLAHGDVVGTCSEDKPGEEDDGVAPVISDITITTTNTTAIIAWKTDKSSNSKVEYALESLDTADSTITNIDNNMVTSHSIQLTGLQELTTYYFVVKSEGDDDNQAVSSEMTFTTKSVEGPDTEAPVITEVEAETEATSTAIAWTTDEDSDSEVEYALESLATASSTVSVSDSGLTTSHSITLPDLTPGTTYYFIVKSKDENNNLATSTETTFTTDQIEEDVTPPIITAIVVDEQATSTTITWTTDEDSDSEVEYALESLATASSTVSVSDSGLTTSHSITLPDLTPDTTYYFVIRSTDESDNLTTSTEDSFITLSE